MNRLELIKKLQAMSSEEVKLFDSENIIEFDFVIEEENDTILLCFSDE